MLEAASTVHRLAQGDLKARAQLLAGSDGESRQLLNQLNHLGASLDRLEGERAYEAAAVAHELRTPLTAMQARLHALLDGLYPLTTVELRPLVTQLDLLTALANDLRTLTLADAGQLALQKDEVDLNELLTDVVAAVQPLAQVKGVTVLLRPGPERTGRVDVRYLRMALGNVLDNAVRHARTEVVVSVDAGRIEVLDDGPGLTAAEAARVGERFYRADPSRTRQTGGSGLGLAVVQTIMRAHGGHVTAEAGRRGRFILCFQELHP
ncbi:hypothetical protein K7W42_18665 [Deinococcus sp. HMF7604]|uniref:sensor histidine kinase n=1 Tax=Deinococcus betulae TaxID=2873312 RepID=UPI001CCB827F|nr:hypothetical protein [Deinococcus betulae]